MRSPRADRRAHPLARAVDGVAACRAFAVGVREPERVRPHRIVGSAASDRARDVTHVVPGRGRRHPCRPRIFASQRRFANPLAAWLADRDLVALRLVFAEHIAEPALAVADDNAAGLIALPKPSGSLRGRRSSGATNREQQKTTGKVRINTADHTYFPCTGDSPCDNGSGWLILRERLMFRERERNIFFLII